jgi:hypothetical protein
MADVSAVKFIRSHGFNRWRQLKWMWWHCVLLWGSLAVKSIILQLFSVAIREAQNVSYWKMITNQSFWRYKVRMWSDLDRHLWTLKRPKQHTQEKCQIVNELYNNILAFRVKLPFFHSELFITFQSARKYFSSEMNSGEYVRHIVVIYWQVFRRWSEKFWNVFEASYEDAEHTLQPEPTDLHCSEFKEGNLHTFCVFLKTYLNLWHKAAVCASLFGTKFLNKLSH